MHLRPPVKALLLKTSHRPWPIPQQNWIWYQQWLDAAFLHWSFSPVAVQPLLPRGLSLDLFEGRAWVSVVAFNMVAVHPRGLWPVPGLSNFAEVNVRTYVVRDGKPGVYFLSIEAANPIAAWLARILSPLPYQYRGMRRYRERDQEVFTVGQASEDPHFHLVYRPGKTVGTKSDNDLWLTERYCLYAHQKNEILRAEVHHEPWPVQRLEVQSLKCSYRFSDSVHFQEAPEICHYSPGVPIVAWKHERI
jgi:uncharacterized protein YqjF (DUF2071 family)